MREFALAELQAEPDDGLCAVRRAVTLRQGRRLVWLNVHRFAAAVVALGVVGHVALHWRPFCRVLAKVVPGPNQRRIGSEPLLYLVFLVAAGTGLVAWLVVEGSSPVRGPAVVAHVNAARHAWVDVHHMSSLVALGLVVHHVWHRARSLTRWPRGLVRGS